MQATHRVSRVLVLLATVSISGSFVGGCSYLGEQLAQAPAQDTRIQLSATERRILRARDLAHYRCPDGHLLTCESVGGISRSCVCALR